MGTYYLLQHFGVIVSAISGVLAAEGKRLDLFGVTVLGTVTALGGGTLRDVVLGFDLQHRASTVFWIRDSNYVITATATAVVTFFLAKYLVMPPKLFAIADAFALAMFTILGAEKALAFGAGAVNAVVLGVITGVAGGVLRDVLVGEIPLVFRAETYFYATAAFGGAILFVVLEHWLPGKPLNVYTGAAVVLALRLAGIRWRLTLPVQGGYRPK